MLQKVTLEQASVTLNGRGVYYIMDREPGDHSGVYVQIEHVDDLLKVMDSVAANLIAMERMEKAGYGCPVSAAVGDCGRELLNAIEKLGRKTP